MSPVYQVWPRAPADSPTPTAATSIPTSTSTFQTAFTSWDTRVGSPVYSSWGPTGPTPTASHGSKSFLSSKPAVAALCTTIAVVCLLLAGFMVYRVQARRNKSTRTPSGSSTAPPASSTARSSKLPPSPFKLGARLQYPVQDDVSNASSRTLRQSHQSRIPLADSAAQPGQVVEFPLITYQHISSSVSAYNSLQRLSVKELTEGAVDGFHGYPSRPRTLERSLSATESQTSNVESASQITSSSTPQPVSSTTTARRPLPAPPHPPPAYEATSSTVPGPLSPLRALASHARTLAFPDADPSGSTHSLGSTIQPTTTTTSQPFRGVSVVSVTQTPRIEYAYTVNLTTGERSTVPRPTHANNPPTTASRNASIDLSSSPLASMENDPFSNSRYELPGWLSSDPFPQPTLKRSTSQPSLYGTARSVAASSRVLPSDSSIRTLTPEPASPRAHSPPLLPPPSLRPVSAATSSFSIGPGPVEGAGPPAEDLIIQHGPERPGWAKSGSPLALSTSRSRRRVPEDGFEANESHPSSRRSLDPLSPPPSVGATGTEDQPSAVGDDTNGSGMRRSTFLSMTATPLSEAIPTSASGRGLSRAFSTESTKRPIPRPHPGGAALSRGRSYGIGSPPPLGSATFSARGGLSGYEDMGWLDMNPGSSASQRGMRKRNSLAASSNVLPSDFGSIRSISPEVGYIPTGESIEDHEPVEGDVPPLDRLAVQGAARESRLSVGEGGILWGRLTSVMEAQEHPTDKAPQ